MIAAAPVALITGASGGLGVPVTGTFAGAGFRVIAVARRWADAAAGEPGVMRLEADAGDDGDAQRVVQTALSSFGRIDALIHLVGGFAGGDGVAETAPEEWQKMMTVNCWTAVTMMRAAVPSMRAAGRGRIVVIASRAAADPPSHYAAYAASKAALLAVAPAQAAAELRKSGVTVNAILPGTIDTAANRRAMGSANAAKWVQPASIGSLLLWLCSDAGRDMTGAAIAGWPRMRLLAAAEIDAALAQLPGWTSQDGKLHREYVFADFIHAFGFMATSALAIEAAGHHPDWSNVWNRVSVDLSTHDAGGVTEKDTALAGQLEAIAQKLLG